MAWLPGMAADPILSSGTGSYIARILVLVVLVGVAGVGGGDVRAEVGGEIQLDCPGEGRGGCR